MDHLTELEDVEEDVARLKMMNDLLMVSLEFIEDAVHERDYVRIGAYLSTGARYLRGAMEVYLELRRINAGKEEKK